MQTDWTPVALSGQVYATTPNMVKAQALAWSCNCSFCLIIGMFPGISLTGSHQWGPRQCLGMAHGTAETATSEALGEKCLAWWKRAQLCCLLLEPQMNPGLFSSLVGNVLPFLSLFPNKKYLSSFSGKYLFLKFKIPAFHSFCLSFL